jgi:hypothetical protein
MDQAAKAGDPEAVAAVDRVKASMDPFGDIVGWYKNRAALARIGNDPDAYAKRVREELLADPEVQKQILERARGSMPSAQPVFRGPSSTPSLATVGSAALPTGQDEASDAELFTAMTRRKRGTSRD